jgi:hypothetical protein
MTSLSLKQEYKNCNDYETSIITWSSIITYIPKDKIIYEPFWLNGSSKKYLTDLGIKEENIIHLEKDFFEYYKKIDFDCIISNPPFEHKKSILKILKELDKPFLLLLPISCISKQYFQKLFKNDNIQLLIPHGRTQFNQYDNKTLQLKKSNVYFDTCWIAYKMNYDNDIIFLN